ncbi:hypothetical protein ZWY2020_032034 [Hordeum vulgare]|nr:hypothetical protein ZWY2020_032034 [Hordeum vulgare]
MEDSEREYMRQKEEEWKGLQEMLELSASGDVCVPKLDVKQETSDLQQQQQQAALFMRIYACVLTPRMHQ